MQQKRGQKQECAHLIRGRSHHAAWVDEMASITRLCAGEPSRGCNSEMTIPVAPFSCRIVGWLLRTFRLFFLAI